MRPSALACRSLTLAAALALPLAAQELVVLDQLEVTAQKRAQPITEVPMAISAFTGDFLASFGAADLKSLAPFVPGLFIQEQSPNNPGINIRGITTDSGDPRSETRVSLFQDGVSISRARGSVVELHDLERVEVVKGPQGTLFGRGAQIGAVSIVQQKPQPERSSALHLAVGDTGQRHVSGHINLPLGSDELLGRFAFSHRQHDGTIDNLVDGSDLNGKKTTALRGSLRWQPAAATTVDLIVNWQNDNPPGTSFKSGVIPTTRGDTDPFTAAELNRGRGLYIDRTVWGLTGLVEHEVNERWSVSSITGWREFDSYEEFDADGSRLFLLELAEDAQGRQFSQEIRFNYDSGGAFAGFIGAGYFWEKGTQAVPIRTSEQLLWPFLSGQFKQGLIAAGLPAALVNAAVPTLNPFVPQATLPQSFAAFGTPGLPPQIQALAGLAGVPLQGYYEERYANHAQTRALDVFADGTWRISEAFELNAGLRLTRERITAGYTAFPAPVPGRVGFILTGGSPNNVFRATPGRLEESDTLNSWVARLAGRYEVSRGLNLFASVARGRRPDSITFDQSTLAPVRLREEVVWNYEVGLKGTSGDGRMLYDASVFRYDYDNFQTTVTDPTRPGQTLATDAGRARGQGFEASLRTLVTGHLSLFGAYGYTDAKISGTDNQGRPQALAGNTFRLTARHGLSVGGELTLPAEEGTVFFTPAFLYKSRHYFEDDNRAAGGTLVQPGYGIVNARLGYRTRSGAWELAAYGENLFNKRYLIDAGNTGGAFGIPTYIAGTPRLLGVQGTFRF
jgi:iron complex outermembrane receptor protein